MKILILFSALLILNTMFFSFQSDMNSYIRESNYIKCIADECAAGASSFYDKEELSEGYYVFSRENCVKYVTNLIENSFENTDDIVFDINYYDTYGVEKPAIEVVLTVGGRDRFSLPFIYRDEIKRAGYFEITGY